MNRDYWDQQDHKLLCSCSCPETETLSLLLSGKGTDYTENTGAMAYVHIHKQLLLSAKLWGKSQPAKQIFLYFRDQQPLHLSAMCWLCSRGMNANTRHGYPSTPIAETFVFMQECPRPNFSC